MQPEPFRRLVRADPGVGKCLEKHQICVNLGDTAQNNLYRFSSFFHIAENIERFVEVVLEHRVGELERADLLVVRADEVDVRFFESPDIFLMQEREEPVDPVRERGHVVPDGVDEICAF